MSNNLSSETNITVAVVLGANVLVWLVLVVTALWANIATFGFWFNTLLILTMNAWALFKVGRKFL